MGKRQQNNSSQDNAVDSLEKLMFNFISVFKDDFFWFTDNYNKTHFSENLFDVTGYSSDEIKSLQEIVYEEDLVEYKKNLYAFEEDLSKDEIILEFRIVNKSKETIWVNESLKIFRDESGKIIRLIGRVIDISGKKTIENQLKDDNETLKKENFAKNRFLNLLSHDLKSPFTSILGFTEILMKETSLTETERTEYLLYIYESSEKLLKLINYLLDWSKLQTGKLQLHSERINVQGLVYNCISSLTGTAVRKDIDIKVDIDNSLNVRGDERLLNIVMTNLLSNAIKFSHSESSVYVKVDTFNDNFIEFIVRDNGVGIPDKNKIKMFKIDSMLSTEGTKGERGTGFGLTFSKEIVEKHGGELWYYSEEEKGSEFHFTIPSSPDNILIVELELSLRDSIVKILEKEYPGKLVISHSAYETVNNVDNVLPSVIIIPHETPLMNGAQLIKILFKKEKHPGLKIIVIVDEVTAELESLYNELGDVVLIEKSNARKHLTEALHQVII